jgi:hypothetical protein
MSTLTPEYNNVINATRVQHYDSLLLKVRSSRAERSGRYPDLELGQVVGESGQHRVDHLSQLSTRDAQASSSLGLSRLGETRTLTLLVCCCGGVC